MQTDRFLATRLDLRAARYGLGRARRDLLAWSLELERHRALLQRTEELAARALLELEPKRRRRPPRR